MLHSCPRKRLELHLPSSLEEFRTSTAGTFPPYALEESAVILLEILQVKIGRAPSQKIR